MKNILYDKYGNLREIWGAIGITVICSIMFILLILIFAATLSVVDAGECARLESYESQHDYRWGLFTGCMVQTKAGYWVDSDNPTLLEFELEE